MARDRRYTIGVFAVIAIGVILVALAAHRAGDRGRLAALRAKVARLEARQAAARTVAEDATRRWPGDFEKVAEASRGAGWLTPEEWGELIETRERIAAMEAREPGCGPHTAGRRPVTGQGLLANPSETPVDLE